MGDDFESPPDPVETEVFPRPLRHERIDLDRFIGAWPQTDQTADHEVAVGGMIVVLATLLAPFARIPGAVLPGFEPRPGKPVTVGRVEVFINPRNHPAIVEFPAMGGGINLEQVEVISALHDVLLVLVEQVRHPGQRDRGGEHDHQDARRQEGREPQPLGGHGRQGRGPVEGQRPDSGAVSDEPVVE